MQALIKFLTVRNLITLTAGRTYDCVSANSLQCRHRSSLVDDIALRCPRPRQSGRNESRATSQSRRTLRRSTRRGRRSAPSLTGTPGDRIAGQLPATASPGGTTDNSPAFQRRVRGRQDASPDQDDGKSEFATRNLPAEGS